MTAVNNEGTSSWVECKFGDLLDYIQPTNFIVSSTEYDDSFRTPVLTAGKSFVKGYTNEEHGIFENLPVIIFDDFTTASRYVNFPFKVKSSAMKILRPSSPLVNLRFLYYFMQANPIRSDTHKRYWISEYAKKSLLLPPYHEQDWIVAKIEALFSELDKGIESLNIAQEQLKAYRHAVLKHAFEGKFTEGWRKDNKDILETTDELLERIKQGRESQVKKENKRSKNIPRDFSTENFEWLPELPNEWKWERLGWSTCGVDYGTSAKSAKAGEVPVLRMGNIQNARFDWTDLVYTSDVEEIQKYSLKTGDVLFNRTNSPELVGKTAVYRGEQPAIFAGYLIRVNQIETFVDNNFLTFFLNSHVSKQYGNQVKTDGVNQSNINGEKLINYPFPYCSLEEQRQIADILNERFSEIDRTEKNIQNQLQKAEALRQSILKRAFSGNLVTKNLDHEPASILLERIKVEKGATLGSKSKAS